jgi:hypothetical protein
VTIDFLYTPAWEWLHPIQMVFWTLSNKSAFPPRGFALALVVAVVVAVAVLAPSIGPSLERASHHLMVTAARYMPAALAPSDLIRALALVPVLRAAEWLTARGAGPYRLRAVPRDADEPPLIDGAI